MSHKTTTTSSNQFAYQTPPPTVATTNLQNMVNTPVDYATPIRNSYARAEQQTDRSYNNPLGAATTADVRDKSMREYHNTQQQNLGLDLSNAAQQSSQDQFGRQATVAGFTRPDLINTGGTQVTRQPFDWGSLAGGALAGTGAALSGGLSAGGAFA